MVKDCVSAWNNCLLIIRENIGEQAYRTWFTPIVPLKLIENVLTIQVPSQFFYEWLEEHYVTLLRKAIDRELGKEGRLEYSVIVDKGNENNKPLSVSLPTSKNGAPVSAVRDVRSPFELRETSSRFKHETQLNKNYTFDFRRRRL